MELKKIKTIILGTLIVIVIGGTAIGSVTKVPAGSTGIKIRMGAVQDASLKEGLNFKLPFIEKVILMDNRTQIVTVDGNSASKDLQTVDNSIAVNFRINPEKSAYLYKNVGVNYINTIITPAIQESTKSVIAQYTAEELITKRTAVGEGIKKELIDKVEKYGIGIENLNIVNFQFSEEFNKAIEAKQTAQQNALKAQEDLSRIEIEAKQKIAAAEGEAKANELLSQSIDENVIKQRFIEKWDGKLPSVTGSNGNMFDISSILENK
ncbi:MAG: prohibitin family protein [Clostridiales bacterium]|nr:prohibitin family protein [Clostridiales bacterium]